MKKGIIALAALAVVIILIMARTPVDDVDVEVAEQLVGVDLDAQLVRIGALNDESGPAATIGRPFAVGKRVLVRAVNEGDLDLLPEGWRIELVERDHGYNPQHAMQAYQEIKDRVLFIATSFGTPNTLPLVEYMQEDNLIAFPASLSSEFAKNELTPPLGTPYRNESMRALDWAVEHAGGTEDMALGIIYQQDDYGADGLEGLRVAAEHHGVEIVSRQTVAPGQTDYTAAVVALQEAGANYVILTTLPSGTGPILGTAAQLQYMPVWIGNTPSWIDQFFNPEVIPSAVFGNFYWATGMPFWGEDVPGMAELIQAYETHGSDMSPPDFYIIASYVQGLIQLEALRRAIESGDLTRSGYKAAMQTVANWDADGLIQPVDLSVFPYETGSEVRILRPDMEGQTWEVVADYAVPASLDDGELAAVEEE